MNIPIYKKRYPIEAKRLFIKFSGNKYEMEREGVLEKYLSFSIPCDTEKKWLREKFDEIEEQIGNHIVFDYKMYELFQIVKTSRDILNVNRLLNLIKINILDADGFTKILLSEELFELSTSIVEVQEMSVSSKLREMATEIFKNVDRGNITIHPIYNKMPHLSGLLSQGTLHCRLNRLGQLI